MGTITCPRCFALIPADPGTKYCPRCGLDNVVHAADDRAALQMTVGDRIFHILKRLAVGAFCNLYRCNLDDQGRARTGIFKIARDARCNWAVEQDARILERLQKLDTAQVFVPFFPRVVASLVHGDGDAEASRQAMVLAFHKDIGSPDELYSLEEVKAAYPAGLDARDVAWIWRRLLHVLAFVHSTGTR